jgi:hypothetical protein
MHYLLERNILAVQRLHEVLPPIDNLEPSISVKFSNVTCLKPAILKSPCVLFGIIEITLSNGATSNEDLALRRISSSEITQLCTVDQLHLHRSRHWSNG